MMKSTIRCLGRLFCFLSIFLLSSCVDSDYEWDDINKEGELSMPPILKGSFDTIWIKDLAKLPTIPPVDLPGGGITIAYEYVFEDMFNEDLIDRFFYDGNHVSLSGLADIIILNKNSGLSLGVVFEVLNENYLPIKEIKIPNQSHFVFGKDQNINIDFAPEYMKYFEEKYARHLKASIVIKASSISIKQTDYLLLKKVVLKADGMHIEL